MVSTKVGVAVAVKDTISNGVGVWDSFRELEEAEKRIYCEVGGAYVGYEANGGDIVVVLEGQYDANAMLKMSRLEKEGYAEMAGIDSDVSNKTVEIKEAACKNIGEDQISNYGKYLLWTGDVYENEYGKSCEVQTFSDISPDILSEGLREFDGNSSDGTEGFRYYDYNIINEYYLGVKGNE